MEGVSWYLHLLPASINHSELLSYFSLATMSALSAVPALFHLPRQLRQIDRVNQLTHPSKISPMGSADQPGKLAQLGFILLLPERFARVYLHWMDKETAVRAFASPEGKTGPADSASFQHSRGGSVQIFPGDLGK